MKAIISQVDMMGGKLWEPEAFSVIWDTQEGDFVIRGGKDNRALTGVLISMMEQYKLTIETGDMSPATAIWRGYVRSARVQAHDSGRVECSLTMLLEDWFGTSLEAVNIEAAQMGKAS